jgi:hypothetical protein
MTFRQIHTESIHGLRSFLKGEPSDFLENLTLTLLENAGARSNGKEVQEHLKNIQDFWRHEARPLFEVRQKTRTSMYPVSQKDRDLLFLKAKSGSLESPDWVHST